MIKLFIFCFILSISNSFWAQDDEYVINKPKTKKEKKAKNRLFSNIDNPDFTNYFLTPSAFTLKSRDIRISGTDLILYKGSYGLTNNITASINTSFFGTLTANIKQKFDVNEDIKIAYTATLGSLASIDQDSITYFGGGQLMSSYGDIQNNITLGIGYYYAQNSYDNDKYSLYHIFGGLQKQISRRVYLLGDFIFFPRFNIITAGVGVKIIIKDNMSLNIGVMPISFSYFHLNNRRIRESIIIPIISFRILLDRH